MTGYPGDPRWDQILATSEEEDAWRELQDRLDREAEYAPAPICPPFPSGAQHPAAPCAAADPGSPSPQGDPSSPHRGERPGNGARPGLGIGFGDDRLPERFWSKARVDPSGCWIWIAAQTGKGYGQTWDSGAGRNKRAHRYAYERLVGPIPDGLQLDHVKARGCTSRLCVNPAHLEPVTNAENARRGDHYNRRKTHCPQGHEYTPENTHWRPTRSGRGRECITCRASRVGGACATCGAANRDDVAMCAGCRSVVAVVRRTLAEGMWADGWRVREMAEVFGVGTAYFATRRLQDGWNLPRRRAPRSDRGSTKAAGAQERLAA